MKATELRIGNLVWLVDKKKTWEILDGHEIDKCHDNPLIKPIPITEEWLQRFGAKFKLVDNNYRYWGLDHNNWQSYWISKAMPNMKSNELWSFTIKNKDGKSYELYSIKHVHQLQNLYFTLTGEDLKLYK